MKTKRVATKRTNSSLYVQRMLRSGAFSEDALKRAEKIFKQVETLPTPVKEEMLVRLIIDDINDRFSEAA